MIDENTAWEDHIKIVQKKTCKNSRATVSRKTSS